MWVWVERVGSGCPPYGNLGFLTACGGALEGGTDVHENWIFGGAGTCCPRVVLRQPENV